MRTRTSKQLNGLFGEKPFVISFDEDTKKTIVVAVSIISLGMIVSATIKLISSRKSK